MVHFRIMAGENNNDVFQKIWLKTLNSIRKSCVELTMEGIVEHLWEPAFEECMRLLDEIRDLTILLSSVDTYFLQYNDERHIVTHLFSLYTGVEMCRNNRRPSNHPMWLKRAVHLMVQYWKLCQYTKAAKVVIDVSVKLKITGDFSLMRTLATKVCYHEWSIYVVLVYESQNGMGRLVSPSEIHVDINYPKKIVSSLAVSLT